jgi:hypothetical protein
MFAQKTMILAKLTQSVSQSEQKGCVKRVQRGAGHTASSERVSERTRTRDRASGGGESGERAACRRIASRAVVESRSAARWLCVWFSPCVQRTHIPQNSPHVGALRQCPQWIFLPAVGQWISQREQKNSARNHAREKSPACMCRRTQRRRSTHVLDTNSAETVGRR